MLLTALKNILDGYPRLFGSSKRMNEKLDNLHQSNERQMKTLGEMGRKLDQGIAETDAFIKEQKQFDANSSRGPKMN